MSLDVLLEPIPAKTSSVCKIIRIVESLDEPYSSALLNLVETHTADGGLSIDDVAERMRKAGLAVGTTTLSKHRKGLCSCPDGGQ